MSGVFPILLRRGFLVFLTAILVIALTNCNPTKLNKAAQSQLVVSILSDLKTFNYALNQDASNIFGLTYEGLVTENQLNGEIEPAQAESWEFSKDKQRITFTLREGLKWSDGADLTADDVVFTYNDIYFNEAIPTDTRDTLRIGTTRALPTVRKLDNRRIEFSLPESFAPFLRSVIYPILPAHVLSEAVKAKDSSGNPKLLTMWGVDTDPAQIIVNGRYELESYATNERVVFRRNPYYWRQDAQGKSQPYIERVIWQIVESTDTSLLQFRSAGLDAVSVYPEFFSLLKAEEKRGKFTIYNGGPAAGSWTFISFNLNKGKRNGRPLVDPIKSRWFNTVAFRQAIAYAIDRQTMINNTFRGLGEPQNSSISIKSPYYSSSQEGLKIYNYNLEKAQQLLLGAGFQYNDKRQLLDADGNRVRFTLITNAGNKIREAIGSQVKRDLSNLGIQIDFNPVAWNTLTDKLTNSLSWECHLMGLSGSGFEPNDSANVWSPEGGMHTFNQKPQAGQTPIVGQELADWEQEINRLYIQAAREVDDAKRKAIYAEADRLIQEYLPYIYLVNPLAMAAVRDQFVGIQYSPISGAFWNIHQIKVTAN